MTNTELVKSRLKDARQFLEYAEDALRREIYHHTVQFAQRAAELAVKALVANEAAEVPQAHDLAKLASNLESVRGLPTETQSRFYECNRKLAKERIVSTYGAEDGTPPDKIFDKPQAEEALEQGKFVLNTVESLVKTEE